MKVTVITISDRAFQGVYKDLSGPAIGVVLQNYFAEIDVQQDLVPDEKEKLVLALTRALDSDFIITTGGTGLAERDITPEVCAEFCEKELPGIAEILRAKSYEQTPYAMLSRGYAGVKNKTIIVNFPGSVAAARFCAEILCPIMQHAIETLHGGKH